MSRLAKAAFLTLLLAPGLPDARAQMARPGGPTLDASVAAMGRKYGLTIELARAFGSIPGVYGDRSRPKLSWVPASEGEYLEYLPIFEGALKKYPPGLLGAAGLRRVVWCGGFGGPGMAPGLGGLFWSDDSSIYLNVIVGKDNAGGRRHTVHHEIFHALDYRRDRTFRDQAWEAISGSDAYYRPRLAKAGLMDPSFLIEGANLGVLERQPGFMTSYAKSKVCEDKAEMFACMMSLPLFVETRMKGEPKIVAKVARIEADLKALCPSVPYGFWEVGRSAD